MQRRRRDLNPRAAFNDLHPFQGCPFGQLGYFSRNTCCPTIWRLCLRHILLIMIESHLRSNGEDGIRTHAPLRTNGFQDRLVIATSIPLQNRFVLLFCSARLIYHPADRMSTLFLWAYFMKHFMLHFLTVFLDHFMNASSLWVTVPPVKDLEAP